MCGVKASSGCGGSWVNSMCHRHFCHLEAQDHKVQACEVGCTNRRVGHCTAQAGPRPSVDVHMQPGAKVVECVGTGKLE